MAWADAAERSGVPMALAISDELPRRHRARSRDLQRPAGSRRQQEASWRERHEPACRAGHSGWMRRRLRPGPAKGEGATGPAAAFVRARSRACTPFRPSRTHHEVDGSRRGGRTLIPPPAGTSVTHRRPAHPARHHSSGRATASLRRDRGGTRRDSARDPAERHTIVRARSSTRTRDAGRRSPDTPPARCSRYRPPPLAILRPRSPRPSLRRAGRRLRRTFPRRMRARPRP